MTLFLPLDPAASPPSQPPFLVSPSNPAAQLAKTIQAIMKAKRIVVICGAGISVEAGIPDFRSSEGLFQTIKRDNPKEAMSSGKELFDVSVFNSEQKTSLFCQMIAQLSDLSQAAEPTSFHHALRALDDRGRLLRVYTQNIDAIEQKCGLSFGVPEFEGKRLRSRSKAKTKAADEYRNATDDVQPIASTSRLPSPPVETPRCIPLHGTLQSMHCQVCNKSFPLQEYMQSLVSGQPPPCPECTELEQTRQLVGKRPRGIGKLRPSVVLYNEAHKDGEGVGDVVQKDLIGSSKGKGRSGADLLLVVGTSLKVPGTKRMVREFAKAVWARVARDDSSSPGGSGSGPSTPAPSPRRSPTADDESMTPPKAIYLNLDFPVPTREWEGVFDAWIQGDAQEFAEVLRAEIEKEARAKEAASEKKRRKDQEAALLNTDEHELPDLARMQERNIARDSGMSNVRLNANVRSDMNVKRKSTSNSPDTSNKKKKATPKLPLSPPYTPPTVPRVAAIRRNVINVDAEDVDGDILMHDPPPPPPPKLVLRIPPPRERPSYVPYVYITSRAPHYIRPYEAANRPRSISPPIVIDDKDEIGGGYATGRGGGATTSRIPYTTPRIAEYNVVPPSITSPSYRRMSCGLSAAPSSFPEGPPRVHRTRNITGNRRSQRSSDVLRQPVSIGDSA